MDGGKGWDFARCFLEKRSIAALGKKSLRLITIDFRCSLRTKRSGVGMTAGGPWEQTDFYMFH
jgi:hypothetical protein